MSRLIDNAHVDIISRGLLGAVDVDGGPTDEQRRILQAIVAGYWERPDIDLTSANPAGPDEVAIVLTDDDARERFHELVADAFRRGTRCTADFSTADHLSMVELTVEQVRERFGVPPLDV